MFDRCLVCYEEQLMTMYNNKYSAFASNFVIPLAIVFIFQDILSNSFLLLLFSIQMLLGIIRIYSANKGIEYINQNIKDNIYLKVHLMSIFLTSVSFGITAILTVFYATELEVYMIIALFFGLSTGAISTLSSVFISYLIYIIPFNIMFIISLLISKEDNYNIISIVLIVYLLITIPSASNMFKVLKNNIEKTKTIEDQQKILIENKERLLESEKLKSMGEMLGNIAHQWRQPLSSITTVASGIVVQKRYDMFEIDTLEDSMDNIIEQSMYLSETIDTFRDFIKDDKKVQIEYIEDMMNSALKIGILVLNENNIKLINNIKTYNEIKIKSISGEFSQVILNILNNAKDALVSNKIKTPTVELNVGKINNVCVLTIEDNAGGIKEELVKKIFEPYFTTKHKNIGTGLGLNMAYRIIVQGMQGNIYARNTDKGAKFYIELPIYHEETHYSI